MRTCGAGLVVKMCSFFVLLCSIKAMKTSVDAAHSIRDLNNV